MKTIDIDIDKALELAHQEYLEAKVATLSNLRGLKTTMRKLERQGDLTDETYSSIIRIINNTIKFIKMKEI